MITYSIFNLFITFKHSTLSKTSCLMILCKISELINKLVHNDRIEYTNRPMHICQHMKQLYNQWCSVTVRKFISHQRLYVNVQYDRNTTTQPI